MPLQQLDVFKSAQYLIAYVCRIFKGFPSVFTKNSFTLVNYLFAFISGKKKKKTSC
jgi:hypothetical protein